MLAFALSGGSNRGALQVGAMQALLEQGHQPDMLVGSSIGSINAAYMASNPTYEGVKQLSQIWREVTVNDVYPGGVKTALWHLIRRRPSLYPNDRWHAFLTKQANKVKVRYFGELARPCYIIATDLYTGETKIFGEDPNDLVVDALVASTALPPMHPPYEINGRQYVDGNITHALPVRVAADHGATAIVGLNLINQTAHNEHYTNIVSIAHRSVGIMLRQSISRDIEHLELAGDYQFKMINLRPLASIDVTDFTRMDELIEHGHSMATAALTFDTFAMHYQPQLISPASS